MSKSKSAMLEIPSSFIRIRFSSDGQSILVISNIVFFIQIAVFIGITLPLYISAIRNIFLFCSSLNITKHPSTSSPPPQQQSPPRSVHRVDRLVGLFGFPGRLCWLMDFVFFLQLSDRLIL